jgi:uncharacterized protein
MMVIALPATSRRPEISARAAFTAILVLALGVVAWRERTVIDPAAVPYVLLLAGGLASGLLAGLLGIGGALVMIPVLYAALPGLGIDVGQVPATAVATALVAMAPTTIVAAWRQHRHGTLDLTWLRRLLAPMTLGAAAGALAAARVDGPVLALLFAAQCLGYGVRLMRLRDDPAMPLVATGASRGIGRLSPWLAGPAMAGFCACAGMGAGSLVTRYLQQRGVAFRQSVATSSALNLCIALGGSAAFFLVAGSGATVSSTASWPAAALLAGGAVCAVPFGVAVAHRLQACLLRRAVGAIYIVSALTLVAQSVRV